MSLWGDLEASIAAQVATEPAFSFVSFSAGPGLVEPTAYPAVVIYRPVSDRKDFNAVATTTRVLWTVTIVALIMTRAGDSAAESRLVTGGAYDLADKLRAKLINFAPAIASTQAVWTMVPLREELTRLDVGAVDIECSYTLDVQTST